MMNQKEQAENEKLSGNCGYMKVEITGFNRRSWFPQHLQEGSCETPMMGSELPKSSC